MIVYLLCATSWYILLPATLVEPTSAGPDQAVDVTCSDLFFDPSVFEPFIVTVFDNNNNKARQLLCSVQDWNTLVLWTSVQETQMPPRRLEAGQGGPAGGDDDSTKQPELFNVANRGLCSMSKAGRLQNAADCSIVLVGTARCSKYNIKGYMMGLKHYPSRVKEVGC